MTEGGWALRYASHLGYRSPDTPLFLHMAGGLDPIAHVNTASRLGLAGVQDVFATARSVEEQLALGRALAARGLEAGCMLYASFDLIRRPILHTASRRRSDAFLALIENAICVATRIRTRHVGVLVAAESDVPHAVQLESLVENLKYAADVAKRGGVVLGLEPLATATLPPMVLNSLDDAVEAVRRVDHPHVRLIFDTAHVQAIEGDAARELSRVYEYIDLIQLADYPGRLEPGTGQVDFDAILAQVIRRGYRGLIELEHGWSIAGEEGEVRGVARLRELDSRVRHHVA